MKTLLLLRHAQALGTQIGENDKTRKLSPKGLDDAKALGKLMMAKNLQPDIALCSPATRTHQTLENVMLSFTGVITDYNESLYNAGYEGLLNALQTIPADASMALLVAHNPGIHALAAKLAQDDNSNNYDRLTMGYAPGTLSVLSCDIDNWENLKLGTNKIIDIFDPLDYNAPDRPTRWM